MNRYIAILSKDDDSAFGVHFPDLPGCVSAGDTEEEAIANAAIAVRLWLDDVEKPPRASSFAELRRRLDVQEDLADGGLAVLVPVVTAGRKQRLNIMLDPEIVGATDEAAKAAGVSRSLYIERALEGSLQQDIGAVRIPPRSGKRIKAKASS
jgi:predicted RNase H-like HicB family nuclease